MQTVRRIINEIIESERVNNDCHILDYPDYSAQSHEF